MEPSQDHDDLVDQVRRLGVELEACKQRERDHIQLEAELFLRDSAIEHSVCGITISDAQATDMPLIYLNQAFENITGYCKNETLGKNCRFLQGEARNQPGQARLREAIKNHTSCCEVLKNFRKDGSMFWNELTISPVFNRSNELTHFIGIQSDVTEREEMRILNEQHVQRKLLHAHNMEGLATLSSGVAHDFKNLLGVILGFSEMVGEYPEDTELAKEMMGQVKQTVKRANLLVEQIFGFSRHDKIDYVLVSLSKAIQDTHALLKSTVQRKGRLIIDCDIEEDQILAAHSQIQQIIFNLSMNALHALPEKNGEITISLRETKDTEDLNLPATDYLCLQITDNGCGMSEEIQAKLYEPFFTTKGDSGTGLGMQIVRGIVQTLHGGIKVESSVGEGTTFKIYLPKADVAPHSLTLPEAP